MKDDRQQSWWIVVPKCLPLAIPTDLAAKAHDDGRYTVFLGTYVQAYDLCEGRRGAGCSTEATTPAEAIRQIASGPTLMHGELIEEIESRQDREAFAGPPARFVAPPVRKRLAGPPVRQRPSGPPVRTRPAALPADAVLPDPAMIERMRQRIANDGPPMPEVLESVRQDLCKSIDRYEQARASGENMEFPRNRLLAGRAMLAAMEGL